MVAADNSRFEKMAFKVPLHRVPLNPKVLMLSNKRYKFKEHLLHHISLFVLLELLDLLYFHQQKFIILILITLPLNSTKRYLILLLNQSHFQKKQKITL
jgi:hypothetical protein